VTTCLRNDRGPGAAPANVGTVEKARRRGLGTALTAAQVHDARARGCRTASLQSTQMAERVYAAVGFRDLGQILEYVPGKGPVMSEVRIAVGDADTGLAERLDQEISAFNAAVTGHHDGRMLSVAVRGDDGDLRAGLYGWTWGGCGYIDLLWVRDDQRGSGLGARLLAAAEAEIRHRGCDRVALNTHSFQAPGFYARFGYRECGRTPGYPHGHDDIHLLKLLG
jgi:GNAT superfamily N-acetyltransferase